MFVSHKTLFRPSLLCKTQSAGTTKHTVKVFPTLYIDHDGKVLHPRVGEIGAFFLLPVLYIDHDGKVLHPRVGEIGAFFLLPVAARFTD